jgi:hypothetical protein
MTIRVRKLLMAGVAVAMAVAAPLSAGEDSAGADPSVFVPDPSVFVPDFAGRVAALGPEAEVLSTANTDKVVDILQAGQAFCVSLPESVYAVDCLAERMQAAAEAMPATGDYAEARAALLSGAARLNALARANADPAKPRVSAQTADGGLSTTRPLVPVRPEQLAAVTAQAQAIVDETETLLLRSAESSAARKVHYERIAAAVESNKVLLRSL